MCMYTFSGIVCLYLFQRDDNIGYRSGASRKKELFNLKNRLFYFIDKSIFFIP